jgi:hypothetical protein
MWKAKVAKGGQRGSEGAGKRRIGADGRVGNEFHIKVALQKKQAGPDERGPLACAPGHKPAERAQLAVIVLVSIQYVSGRRTQVAKGGQRGSGQAADRHGRKGQERVPHQSCTAKEAGRPRRARPAGLRPAASPQKGHN